MVRTDTMHIVHFASHRHCAAWAGLCPGNLDHRLPGHQRCDGLVQRLGTSGLMDHSGIEQLDRYGEPRRVRQAYVGGQEWTADNFRQGDIRRVVRGEVGTP